jgi:hypothetical protein
VQSCRKVTKIFYAINAGRVFVFLEGADFDDFGKIHVIVFWTEPTKMRLSKAGSTFPALARFSKAGWAFERFRARFDPRFDPAFDQKSLAFAINRWRSR